MKMPVKVLQDCKAQELKKNERIQHFSCDFHYRFFTLMGQILAFSTVSQPLLLRKLFNIHLIPMPLS